MPAPSTAGPAAASTKLRLAIGTALLVAPLACAEPDELPVVARGRYVEIATERDEAICGGTVDYLDRVIEAGFEAIGETPPDRVFVRFEWLEEREEPISIGGEASARVVDDGVLIRSNQQLVHEHELAHAVHLQAWPTSNGFLHEGLAVLFDAKRIYYEFSWPQSVPIDDVLGEGRLPIERYPFAWFLVSQILRDHGFDGLRALWHAVPAGSSAQDVRDAYETLFGRPIDALLEPYYEEFLGELTPVDRLPCNFALCAARTETPWQDLQWSAPGPRDCEDDPEAIGPDRRLYLGEHGEVWRDYTTTMDAGRYDFNTDPSVGGYVLPCDLDCRYIGYTGGANLLPGTLVEDFGWGVSGRMRMEVRAALADLPTQSPGEMQIDRVGP